MLGRWTKMADAMLVDFSKCIGCRACQVACKSWNQLEAEETEMTGSYENPPDLCATTWTKIKFIEKGSGNTLDWHFRRMLCQHCTDAACEKVCPPKAITHQQGVAVVIDQEKCTGCKYCISACPFGVPRYDEATNTAKKCTLCIDRIGNGLTPACAKVCAPGAVVYGERSELISDAKDRIVALQDNGATNVRLYGEDELGGLGVMMLMVAEADVYGLPDKPDFPLSVTIWQDVLKPLTIASGAGAALAVIVSLIGSIGYKNPEEGGG
jgi:formate dehydrogenase iron-sulfur subunit